MNARSLGLWVAFSPDSKTLASASSEWFPRSSVKVWEAATGAEITTFRGAAQSGAFGSDGKTFVCCSNTEVQVWNRSDPIPLATFRLTNSLSLPAFQRDGKHLAGVQGSHIVLWSLPQVDLTSQLTWCDLSEDTCRFPSAALLLKHLGDGSAPFLFLPARSHLADLKRSQTEERLHEVLLSRYRRAGNLCAAGLLCRALSPGPDRLRWEKVLAVDRCQAAESALRDGLDSLAEYHLEQARQLGADQSTLLVYQAILCLRRAKPDEQQGAHRRALGLLESAADRGFSDWEKLEQDSELLSLRADPRFREVVERLLPVEELVRRGKLKSTQPAESIRLYTRALKKTPEDAIVYELRGLAHIRLKQLDEAVADLQRAVSLQPRQPQRYYDLARGYTLRAASRPRTAAAEADHEQDIERAINALEQAVQQGWKNWEHLRTDPDLTAVRGHPRFHAFLQKHKQSLQAADGKIRKP